MSHLGKRQASIPAEDLDVLRGRSSIDLFGSSLGSAAGGSYDAAVVAGRAFRYSAADAAQEYSGTEHAADYGDLGNSSSGTRFGGYGSGDDSQSYSSQLGSNRLDGSQLDVSPSLQAHQTSLHLPRSPLDFGAIGAEAGSLHGTSGSRQRRRAAAGGVAGAAYPDSTDLAGLRAAGLGPAAAQKRSRGLNNEAVLAACVASALPAEG